LNGKTPGKGRSVFQLETRKYKILSIEIKGHCLFVDIPARKWDRASLILLSEDLADLGTQAAWTEDLRNVVIEFDGDVPDPGWGDTDGEFENICLAEPVARIKQPVIGAIRGDALGLGLELALACDIRIGTVDALLGLPQIREGRMPQNGGTQRLPRLVGPGPAMHMILTGDSIDADEAVHLGLFNRVVAPDSLKSAAEEMAQEMAAKSPLSTSFAKEALYSGLDLTLSQGLSKELDLYLQLFSTEDRTEGISAFRERRKPTFKGE
jgi:hypothetical protein